MVKIGEAACDENGKTSYGKPGDQTGKEVRIIDFYVNKQKPWKLIFRAKDKEKRKLLGDSMVAACNNDHIGYAQYGSSDTQSRYGLYKMIQKYHSIADIKEDCNCDCSSLVAQCCCVAGINVSRFMSTSDEVQILDATGQFDKLNFSADMTFDYGDILWRQGHTAIIVAGSDDKYNKEPKKVMQVKKACYVYTEPTTASPKLAQHPSLGVGNSVDFCDSTGNWSYIRIVDVWGWVESKNLEDQKQEQPKPVAPKNEYPKFGKVTTELNLRTSPANLGFLNYCNIDRNDGYGIRHTLHKGEVVKIIGKNGNWYQLEIKGANYTWTPYVFAKYIEIVDKEFEVGDSIHFIGKILYTSSYSAGKAVTINKQFNGTITRVVKNTHPYLVKSDNNRYEGWCNKEDLEF